jgi:hypothetical protein
VRLSDDKCFRGMSNSERLELWKEDSLVDSLAYLRKMWILLGRFRMESEKVDHSSKCKRTYANNDCSEKHTNYW